MNQLNLNYEFRQVEIPDGIKDFGKNSILLLRIEISAVFLKLYVVR